MDLWDKAKEFLMSRRTAYVRVFDFENANVRAVMEDLAKFCRAHETPFYPDQRATDVAIGRQEVWLRLQHHLKLSPDQLWKLYSGGKE